MSRAKTIEKARSAWSFFQKYEYAKLKKEVEEDGKALDFVETQKHIATAWRELDDATRHTFLEMARKDAERFAAENARRDEEVLAEIERKRAERESAVEGPRKTRYVPEARTSMKAADPKSVQRREKARKLREIARKFEDGEMDSFETAVEEATKIGCTRQALEKERLGLSRRRKRASDRMDAKRASNAEKVVMQRLLDADAAKRDVDRKRRMRFLLAQSDVFAHFLPDLMSKSATMTTKGRAAKTAAVVKSPSKRRARSTSEDCEMDDNDDDDTITAFRLTKQPSCIVNGTLRAYQIEGLNWLVNLHRHRVNGILADEMGLGKTLQTISLLAYVKEFEKVRGPHIVLAPKSTLLNWRNEFRKWCPSLRIFVFQGNKDERKEMVETTLRPRDPQDRTFDVCIVSYEIAIIERAALQKIAWCYLAIDEAHRIKNENAKFSRVVRTFSTLHRLLITGTPLQNNLHELWALLNYLLPEVFSDSEHFDEWFDLATDDDTAKEKLIHQLHKILRPFMLRRLKSDVAKDLPPKIQRYLYVGMSEMQRGLYKNILMREMDAVTGGGGKGSKTQLSNIVMQLRKVAAHPYLFDGVEDRTLDPMGDHVISNCGKMVLLDKLVKKLKNGGHRVLIFSLMTRVLDILEDFCAMRGYNYCRIDGNTNGDERQSQIDDYNAEGSDKFVFLLSTRAGGLGINLYTADSVILYDSDWNPQVDLQAMDRAHRIGQKRTVNVYRLLTEKTIEEKIIERAELKLRLDAVVVQQGRLPDQKRALSKDEMSRMVQFGANEVFRAKGSMITDEDIDLILSKGEERSKALQKNLDERFGAGLKQKGGLLDFKMDSTSMQLFEGVDYAQQRKRQEELKKMMLEMQILSNAEAAEQRRQQKKKVNYDTAAYFRQISEEIRKANRSDASANKTNARTRSLNSLCREYNIPRPFDVPRVYAWNLCDVDRLKQLEAIEQEQFGKLMVDVRRFSDKSREWKKLKSDEREKQSEPIMPTIPKTLLPADLHEEQQAIVSNSFFDWRRDHFKAFISAAEECGDRNSFSAIAEAMARRGSAKSAQDVEIYAKKFWGSAGRRFISDWEKHASRVVRSEEKHKERNQILADVRMFARDHCGSLDNALRNLPIDTRTGRGDRHKFKDFTVSEERFLCVWLLEHGFGRWNELRDSMFVHPTIQFSPIMLTKTPDELKRRAMRVLRGAHREFVRSKNLLATKKACLEAAQAAVAVSENAYRLWKDMFALRRKLETEKLRAEIKRLDTNASKSKENKGGKKHTNKSSQSAKKTTKKKATPKKKDREVPKRLRPFLAKIITKAGNVSMDAIVATFQSEMKETEPNLLASACKKVIREIAVKNKGKSKSATFRWRLKPEFASLAKRARKSPKRAKRRVASHPTANSSSPPKKMKVSESASTAAVLSPHPSASLSDLGARK